MAAGDYTPLTCLEFEKNSVKIKIRRIVEYFFNRSRRALFSLAAICNFFWRAAKIILNCDCGNLEKTIRGYSLPERLLSCPQLPNHERKEILLFAYLPEILKQSIPLASILGQLGHKVRIVFLPHEDYRREELWYVSFYNWVAYKHLEKLLLPGVTMTLLPVYHRRLSSEEEREVMDQSLMDTCNIVMSDEYDGHNRAHSRVHDFRLRRNREAIASLGHLLDVGKSYDFILVPSGGIMEFGIASRLSRIRKIPFVCFQNLSFENRVVVSYDRPVTYMDTESEWQSYKKLCEEETLSKALELIRKRSIVKSSDQTNSHQFADPQSADILYRNLDLQRGCRTALLCCNVAWDSVAMGRHLFFRNSKKWIIETVQWFAGRPGWQLIVRVHPYESTLGTEEPIRDIVLNTLPPSAVNVRVIDSKDPINTYSLMAIADMGIVHTSSVGMEMAILGLPVICAGRSHYRGKGFTFDPSSKEEYFDILGCSDFEGLKKKAESLKSLAAAYFLFYTQEWQFPFPWDIWFMDRSIKEWPVQRILSKEGLSLFGNIWSRFSPSFKNNPLLTVGAQRQ
jgi:hypothetical protein